MALAPLPAAQAGQWIVHYSSRTPPPRLTQGPEGGVKPLPGIHAALVRTASDHAPVVQPGATVERDVPVRAFTNDLYWKRQWALDNVSATIHPTASWRADADLDLPAAWALTAGLPIRVAILDTGIDQDHPELAGKTVAQKNFTRSPTVDDLYGHGTHVAGIIAAIPNNGKGISGIAPQAQLLNGKVLDDRGAGSCSSVAQGIIWAAEQGAKIISLSLGGKACAAEQSAVEYAAARGALVIAAAGNNGNEVPQYPAAYPQVLAVAASTDSDTLARFSNRGSWVDIAAPGSSIVSTSPNHTNVLRVRNYSYMSGTSMAVPQVAGAAALAWGQISDLNRNGRMDDELRSRLENSADRPRGWSGIRGGRLNACRAISGAWSC